LNLDKLKDEIAAIPDDAKAYLPSGVEVYFTKDPKTLEQIDYSSI